MAPSTYPHLLSPAKVGALTLPNRVAMAPMTRGRAGETYTANELMGEYYTQRASSGLIITEGTHTSLVGRGWYEAPEVYTPAHAAAWRPVTDAVHAAGGRIFCQLWHTGRASHSSFRKGMPGFDDTEKALAVAPSAIKRGSKDGKQTYTPVEGEVPIETPRALTLDEVRVLPEEFRVSAQTARDAGFDGVEVHCANGYLLDEFLQTCSNERTDEYGGSRENRFRIVEEVLQAVFKVFEPDRVAVRLSPNGAFNGMGSPENREDFPYFASRLAPMGLAYLHVMIGTGFGFHGHGEPLVMKDFRAVYPGILMANVGYDADSAEAEIASGDTDLVSFGRPYISNPDFVERLTKGVALNPPADHKTYFSAAGNRLTSEGYTDYPEMKA